MKRIMTSVRASSLLTGILLAMPATVAARIGFINPGITLSGTYTDNAAPGLGTADESEFIRQVNPELKAGFYGQHLQAVMDYRLQNLMYNDSEQNATYQQYLARASFEMVPDHFFLDASSSLSQRIIDTNGIRVNNNYAITGNRTDQLTASVRPSWRQQIGSTAEAIMQAESGTVRFDDGDFTNRTSDSNLASASLTVNNSIEQQRLTWKVSAKIQKIYYDDSAFEDLTFKQMSLLLGYKIIPTLTPLALIGYERNDFGDVVRVREEPEDPFYSLGFRWQPTPRTAFEAMAGHRYFGETYQASWTQRGRYTTSTLEYTEDVSGETAFILEDEGMIENPAAYSNYALGLSGEVFLRKRLQATGQFRKSKTTISLSPFYERRRFDAADQDSSISGINTDWTLQIGPRTTLEASYSWNHIDHESTASSDQTFQYIAVGLQRSLGAQTSASLEYSYTDVDADTQSLSYEENALIASFTHWFGKPVSRPSESFSGSQSAP